MKKLLLLTLLSTVLAMTACQTANRSMYVAAAGSQVTVESAMSLWNDYIGLKHPPISQQITVRNLYLKWQYSMMAVCDAGAIVAAAANAPTNTTILSASLQQAIASSDQAKTDLLNAIAQFGVTLK